MPPKRFNCVECNLKYTSKLKLNEHLKLHKATKSTLKTKKCDNCHKIFKTNVLLKKHKIVCKRVEKRILRKDEVKAAAKSIPKNTNKSGAKTANKSGARTSKGQQAQNEASMSHEDGHITDPNVTSKSKPNVLSTVNNHNAKKVGSIGNSSQNSKDLTFNIAEDLSAKTASVFSNIIGSKANDIIKLPSSANGENSSKLSTQIINKAKKCLKPKNAKFPLTNKKNKIENIKNADLKSVIEKENDLKNEESTSNKIKADQEINEDSVDKKTDVRRFTCAFCNKTFSRKYHLDRHLRMPPCSGLPPLSFPCEICHRVYTRKDNLREHLRIHNGEGHRRLKHKCPYCDKAFHGQSLLTVHIRKHTGEKPFSCDFCSKKFSSTSGLTKHRRTHTGEKPFSCPECGHRFSLKGTLSRHLRVHTGIRPHKCLYCGKQFIQIGGLKAHLFYHTGENGFKCEDCGKVFNRKARLQMHKLYVHVKLRPFRCENCSKSFTRKEDLHRHAILHTGEKPYKCPTCNKSFAIKPSLKLHLLTHIKEEPRSCHECGRAFIRRDCLLRHMRKRHRDLLDKILLDEKDEKSSETNTVNSRLLSEEDLCENIQELLSLLVDESTLIGFGWPNKPIDEVLEAVIRRCGHMPVSPDQYSYADKMRENAKLLFTVVIDDNAVKTLLNNQTVDEVILHVLRLAKT